MSFVVDASVIVKWVLSEPDSEAALKLGNWSLFAPELLDAECASVLWKAARHGVLSHEAAAEALAVIGEAAIERLPLGVLLPGAMQHALRLDHPIYDCLYLEAASWMRLPLVTVDRRLRRLSGHQVQVLGLDDLS